MHNDPKLISNGHKSTQPPQAIPQLRVHLQILKPPRHLLSRRSPPRLALSPKKIIIHPAHTLSLEKRFPQQTLLKQKLIKPARPLHQNIFNQILPDQHHHRQLTNHATIFRRIQT